MDKKYIKTNSSIIYNRLKKISEISKKISSIKNKCLKCKETFDTEYFYECNICESLGLESKNKVNSFKFNDEDIHMLLNHNLITIDLYEKVCIVPIEFNFLFGLFNTNTLNIIDGVYESGSELKYIEKNKNIYSSEISRFSEHYGFLSFDDNLVNKVIILNDSRVDKEDPLIYQPQNCLEALRMDYIFHTHPKTPYIGSRVKLGILYEFPSISDIIHFIDHHNNGRLLGSIVLTPEGLYMIHKYYFDREKIKIDTDILIDELYDIYTQCYENSLEKYKKILNFKNLLTNGEVKIPDDIFFTKIADDFDYINLINRTLIKFDLFIDFYPRLKLSDTKFWILPDIYLPVL